MELSIDLTEKLEILQRKIDDLEQEKKAFVSNEKMFHALVETAVGDIGVDFFNNIVKKLSEWLNAECVIIGKVIRDNVVEGFPLYLDGKIISGFTYTLFDTPCDLTSKKGYCVYKDNVIKSFPNSKDLVDLNIEGYVGTALYNKKGEPNGVLCAMSRSKLQLPPQAEDILRIVGSRITAEFERIKAQKALEVSEKNLKIANASKDRFFSIVSHDLKDPFHSLLGFSEILIRDINDKSYDHIGVYARQIHDVSSRSYNLLQNLLEWSLTQTNQILFQPVQFNLFELLNDLFELQTSFANQKNIKLINEIATDFEIFADANMITTIVRNLISNSIKFTSEGGEIRLSASIENGKTKIAVADNGVGIDAKNIKKLFCVENKHSNAGTANEKGTGIGLLLCKELIQIHKGDIWVESKIGEGSVFNFTIGL